MWNRAFCEFYIKQIILYWVFVLEICLSFIIWSICPSSVIPEFITCGCFKCIPYRCLSFSLPHMPDVFVGTSLWTCHFPSHTLSPPGFYAGCRLLFTDQLCPGLCHLQMMTAMTTNEIHSSNYIIVSTFLEEVGNYDNFFSCLTFSSSLNMSNSKGPYLCHSITRIFNATFDCVCWFVVE